MFLFATQTKANQNHKSRQSYLVDLFEKKTSKEKFVKRIVVTTKNISRAPLFHCGLAHTFLGIIPIDWLLVKFVWK